MCSGLSLHRVNPYRPFVLRTDASDYAIGATLEQGIDGIEELDLEKVKQRKTVPVAFLSRKLSEGQRKWVPKEKETYAVVAALEKWESFIGFQPVLVLTDHKSLEWWTTEIIDPPSGPMGRRFRWHEFFSRFNLHIVYVKGSDNVVADALSRYAYPAVQAYKDISRHGSREDLEEVEKIKAEENEMELKMPNREEWLEGDETHPSATELPGDGPVTFVRPVGTPSGTPEKAPLVFKF